MNPVTPTVLSRLETAARVDRAGDSRQGGAGGRPRRRTDREGPRACWRTFPGSARRRWRRRWRGRSTSTSTASSSPRTRCRRTSSGSRSTARIGAISSSWQGPLFANVVLADEINRAAPRTQSALLEAMSEHAVTVDKTRHELARPVPRGGDPEPDRVDRHLPAARVAARPLRDAAVDGLPGTDRRARAAASRRHRARARRSSSRC